MDVMLPEESDDVVGEDYSDARLAGQKWRQRTFTNCNFRDADLTGLTTESVVFTD